MPERTEEGLLARLKRAGLSFVPGAAGKYRFCTVTRQACGTAEPLIKKLSGDRIWSFFYSCDGIDGETARLIGDDGSQLTVPTELLPAGTAEGSVLRRTGDAFVPDPAETARRRAQMAVLLACAAGTGHCPAGSPAKPEGQPDDAAAGNAGNRPGADQLFSKRRTGSRTGRARTCPKGHAPSA